MTRAQSSGVVFDLALLRFAPAQHPRYTLA